MKTEVLNSAKINVMSSVSIREQLLSSNVVFNVGMLDILEFSVADPYTAIVLRPA